MKTFKSKMSLLFLFGICLSQLSAQNLIAQKKIIRLMGTRFEFTAVASNDTLAWKAINAGIEEVTRIEKLISEWDPASEVSEVNRNAGIKPVKVAPELFSLILRANKISELTGGGFDITWAGLDGIWKFDGSMKALPPQEKIDTALKKVGFRKIVMNPDSSTVFLPQPGMKIGFGGIGQGYGVERAKKIMREMGIESGVVNASGDIYAWGNQPDGNPWKISIADPAQPEIVLAWLEVRDMAVVTSGSYFKFVEFNGARYSHIINPVTGWPAHGLVSTTVVCPDTEIADALATGIFVMGKTEGMNLINRLNGIECLMIDDKGEIFSSEGLHLNFYKEKPIPAGQESIRNTK